VSGLGVVKLAGWLPSELLGQIIEASLKKSDKFTEEDLLHAAPPSSLVTHVPLDYIWDKVVRPLIAEQHDYAPKAGGGGEGKKSNESNDGWSMRPAPEAETKGDKGDEGDMVGEDEIIETEEEIRASESAAPPGMRKVFGAPNRKAQQG